MSIHSNKSFLILFLTSALLSACGGGTSKSSSPSTPTTADIYNPGVAAALTTSEESFDGTSDAGESIGILLGDGSSAMIPELAEGFEMTLARTSTTSADTVTIQTSTGLAPTGATRQLTFYGNGDLSELKPVITIPVSEAGSINLDTINVMRIGDLYVNGEVLQNQMSILPVTINEDGALSFVDPMMREGLQEVSAVANSAASSTISSASKQAPNDSFKAQADQQYAWVGSAKYMLMSFQDDLNWKREPKLVRMIPDMNLESSGYRRPATASELLELNKKPICNMVLLVHGHNEQEKEGSYDTTADAPWLFEYKRLVWDLLYREVTAEERDEAIYPYQCTAFYEYIFPTYRAIYSPVSDKNGKRHETLGESLGKLVKAEFANNKQLKAMQDNDMPYNAIVVAHSQGGLVARAGFRSMPDSFKSHITRFISWGSPHHGAALVSLRYALQAGHDMVVDGKRLPLRLVGKNFVSDFALNTKVALDAPGSRDLRWDASKKDLLNIRGLFPSITDDNESDIKPSLFSENLATFNDVIQSELAGISTPYTFFYGTTPKTAELDLVDVNGGWWFQYQAQQVYRFANSSSIEQGAALNRLLMASGQQSSDGAVPIYSQKGEGIYGPETDLQIDIDHEEFYGAEPPARNASTIYKGALTAQSTFDEANLTNKQKSCPTLEVSIASVANTAQITGQLNYGITETPGKLIQGIDVRSGSAQGSSIDGFTFDVSDDGKFTGSGKVSTGTQLTVVAVLKDKSEVSVAATLEGEIFSATTTPFSGNVVREWPFEGGSYIELSRMPNIQIEAEFIADGPIVREPTGNLYEDLTVKRAEDTNVTIRGELRPVNSDGWMTNMTWDTIRKILVDVGEEQKEVTVGTEGAITACTWTLEKSRGTQTEVFETQTLGSANPLVFDLQFPKANNISEWFLEYEISGQCTGWSKEWVSSEVEPREVELNFDFPRFQFSVNSLL